MYDLAEKLKVHRLMAVGLMEVLWHISGKNAPHGDIGRYSDSAIAELVGWPKKGTPMIEALIESGWLDRSERHRLVIHDWPEHCESSVHSLLEKRGENFWDGTPPFSRKTRKGAEQVHGTLHGKVHGKFTPTREETAKVNGFVVGFSSEGSAEGNPWIAPVMDQGWQQLIELAAKVGMQASDVELEQIYERDWLRMGFELQIAAVDGIRQRVDRDYADPAYVPTLRRYLAEHRWNRAIRPKPMSVGRASPEDKKQQEDREFLRMAEHEKRRGIASGQ